MKKRTINQAILKVLKDNGKPLYIKEIYSKIIENDLYRFNAQRPADIVRIQIRRHCDGLDFPSAHKNKYFTILNDGTYFLYDKTKAKLSDKQNRSKKTVTALSDIEDLYNSYLKEFKANVLNQLKTIDPRDFEIFCRNLLSKFGFKDVEVTKKGKDGGIDGYGRLKVGVGYQKVGFQCKRWSKHNVGLKEVLQFKGACSEVYHQGIYFTTLKYTKDALRINDERKITPITLIDGDAIVEMMIEKQFGIQLEKEYPLYSSAIDLAYQNLEK